ncbi:MAG: YraN family protein [Bryobacterales bacterium]|jgi:putative endonuclease|nr:YraN family protein [Bryobacterales bacterium]
MAPGINMVSQLIVRILSSVDVLRHTLQRRVLGEDKALGALGEDLAHRFLQRRGFTIVARNWRTPRGHREVDLIAWQGQTLVFVEVKTRRHEEYLPVERAVDKDKRENLKRAAMSYVLRAQIPWQHVRFDVVSVVLQPALLVRHTPDAFHPDRGQRTRPVYVTEIED